MATMGLHRSDLSAASSVAASWKAQTISIRVLRAFLGVTFLYAGIQKLADPNFLHAGTHDYIGSQLQAFAEGSPLGGLLRALSHVAVLTGMTIALAEIAIGVGTLLGIAPFAMAAVGFVINLVLFLSATWHVHPYFLGSDSIYAVAWAVYLVAMWEQQVRTRRMARSRRQVGPMHPEELTRREVLRGALVGAATLVFAGLARAAAGKPAAASAASGLTGPTGPTVPPGPTGPTGQGSAHAGHAAQHNLGKVVTGLNRVPVGQAVGFTAPGGDPAVLVRLGQQNVVAFSRVCTHAGCLVGYDPQSRVLYCPCHGAEFDPAHGAQPIAGPAPTALPRIPVAIRNGEVVLG
jgi:thiosulfate dehydrogenase [quinone] large subunit